MDNNGTTLTTSTEHLQTHPDDCIKIDASNQMGFVSGNNSDHFFSENVETIILKLKINVLALLFLIGVPANVINMAVFYKHDLRDRVNLCLFALALADGMYLVSAMILYGERLRTQFAPNKGTNPITIFFINNNFTTLLAFLLISPILSAIIATERCVCVFNPLKFQNLLRTRTMAVIIVMVYALVFGMFFITTFRYHIGCFYDSVSGMVINIGIEGEFYKAYKELIDGVDFFLYIVGMPVIEMLVVIPTIMTIVKVRQTATWRSGASTSVSPKEMTLTKMLVGNSILFIVCTFPAIIIRFISFVINFGPRYHDWYLTSVLTAELLSYFNSAFNFFVYYIMGSRYRETFWALFGGQVKAVKT